MWIIFIWSFNFWMSVWHTGIGWMRTLQMKNNPVKSFDNETNTGSYISICLYCSRWSDLSMHYPVLKCWCISFSEPFFFKHVAMPSYYPTDFYIMYHISNMSNERRKKFETNLFNLLFIRRCHNLTKRKRVKLGIRSIEVWTSISDKFDCNYMKSTPNQEY